MSSERALPLDRIRTDGWFQRVGESIVSFQTLCDVLGERFFAFALVTGVRVTSLLIDRFNPDHSLVECSFTRPEGGDGGEGPVERLTVVEFRRRLVDTLLEGEPEGPAADALGDDVEALQRHIGPRALLLAPLYGYGLKQLVIKGKKTTLQIDHGAKTENLDVATFRARLLEHVQEDLSRGVRRQGGTAIDLAMVDDAEKAAKSGEWHKIIQLLGAWPMPLAIYWRTPEGQMLPAPARQRIAEGLGLLGAAVAELGDPAQGEEVLRLAVQYAPEGPAAGKIFLRLARMYVAADRWGEAIAPLRRALLFGGERESVLVDLATAYLKRDRPVAALAVVLEAEHDGVAQKRLKPLKSELRKRLGESLDRWHKLCD
jgi:hypothetical protein